MSESPPPTRPPLLLLGWDPLRLFYGLRQWWWLVAGLPAVLGAVGFVAGKALAENRFSVSLQLLRLPPPSALVTSADGQAYAPQELGDDSLLATTYASEVLERAARRLDPPRTAGELKGQVEINKPRRSDFFYLTAHSRRNATDAVATVLAWAEEIQSFTRGLQQREAAAMRDFIGRQLEEVRRELRAAEEAIRLLAEVEQVVDENAQLAAALGAVEQLRLRREQARLLAEVKAVQIAQYRREILAQNPTASDLRRKREELALLLGRYTATNPLVEEKQEEIARLEERLQSEVPAADTPLTDFTGGDLGNQLYLLILALEGERGQLLAEVVDLDRQLAGRERELKAFPEKRLRLSAARLRRDQLLDSIELLASREREAAFFAGQAPGYLTVFQVPGPSDVAVASQGNKSFLLALGGLAAGLALGLGLVVVGELLHPRLRTPWTVLGAVGAPLELAWHDRRVRRGRSWLPAGLRGLDEAEADAAARLEAFFLRRALADGQPRRWTVWAAGEVRGEEALWAALGALAARHGLTLRRFDLVTAEAAPPAAAERVGEGAGPGLAVEVLRAGLPPPAGLEARLGPLAVFRLHGLPHREWLPWLRAAGPVFVVATPSAAGGAAVARAAAVFREALGPPAGALLVDALEERSVPRWIASLEAWWCRQPAAPKKEADA